MAWKLLLTPDFVDLRRVLYTSEREFRRFRQVLVNMVLATDIMDKELGQQRKERWNAAFETDKPEEPEAIDVKRKATIVLEHLIQASDVAHTMQHVSTCWGINLIRRRRFSELHSDNVIFFFQNPVAYLSSMEYFLLQRAIQGLPRG